MSRKSSKTIVDTPYKGSWADQMDQFKKELREKADEYRAKHGSNIIPEGAVYISRTNTR